jgi:hypothetical protein
LDGAFEAVEAFHDGRVVFEGCEQAVASPGVLVAELVFEAGFPLVVAPECESDD